MVVAVCWLWLVGSSWLLSVVVPVAAVLGVAVIVSVVVVEVAGIS